MKYFPFNLKLIKIGVLFFSLILVSCSGDDEENVDDINQSPRISLQSFTISENPEVSSSLGFISASDPDNDELFYTIDIPSADLSEIIEVIRNTGEIKVLDTDFFDYESIQNFNLAVVVSDGKSAARTSLTFNIINMEDGPLRNIEKRFISEFHFMTYSLSPTSFGPNLSTKWKQEMKLFLDGSITTEYREDVLVALNEFNDLFSDEFRISLTNDINDSNVHLILGPENSIADIWPDIFLKTSGRSFNGYAAFNSNENNIVSGRVWVRNMSRNILMHEIGHIIGLGHASDDNCNTNFSVMCRGAFNPNFTSFDEGIIKLLYHPEVNEGETYEDLEPSIIELILDDFIIL